MTDKYETKPGVRLPEAEDSRPKRFYETVAVEAGPDGWSVRLDGRGVKTPARFSGYEPHRFEALLEQIPLLRSMQVRRAPHPFGSRREAAHRLILCCDT